MSRAGHAQAVGSGCQRVAARHLVRTGPKRTRQYFGAIIDVATHRSRQSPALHRVGGGWKTSSHRVKATLPLSATSSAAAGSPFSGSQCSIDSTLYAELVLSGSNLFSGPLAVTQGAIFLNNANALTQANAVTLTNTAGGSSYSNFFLNGNNARSRTSSSGTLGSTTYTRPTRTWPTRVIKPRR